MRQEDPDRSLLAGTENIEYNHWKIAAWVGGWLIGVWGDMGGASYFIQR